MDALVDAWDLTGRGGGCKFNQRWGEARCNNKLAASNLPVLYEEEDRQPCNSDDQKEGVLTASPNTHIDSLQAGNITKLEVE